ncbi:DMT family transporter [Paracoccus sp. SCSIO 75233]|uniref:DMT family transporter n=1 Tax=Paracoccus sp. SCSIO 75233 TaxID=3017782 RepID=UPI0022F08D3D|nr:DMT family transporter [Paracoccus sp. SCSIO 75233]WBU55255.1 DMT family transporter [Paracoccus sp. SCSIO 75233]
MNRPTTAPNAATEKRIGIAVLCVAMILLPLGDAISKLLTAIITPFEVTLGRTIAQATLFVPVAYVMRRHLSGSIFSLASLISAVMLGVVTLCLVTAFAVMPIATAIAIFFVEPLLLTLLAGPLLGEVPGPRRYAAVAVGLIGALIVIRPNFAAFGPVALLPVLGAFAYALNMIVMRKSTRKRSALSFQFGASIFAAGLLLLVQIVIVAVTGQPSGLLDLPVWAYLLLLLAGVLAMMAFLSITYAFSKVEASLLAPFQYLEIVGATLVGFLFFSEIPDGLTMLGTAIILASGIYVFHRERQLEIEAAASQPVER